MDNNTSTQNVNNDQEKDNSLQLRDIYNLCLQNWKWFVLSVVACLLISVIYLIKTPSVYTRSASLLIKEETKSGSVGSELSSQFSDLGIFSSSSNVYNEVVSLRSPAVMYEVVNRLGLDVSYSVDGHLRKDVLYGRDLPFTIKFPDIRENDVISFTMNISKGWEVSLDDFVWYVDGKKKKSGEAVSGSLNDTLSTPCGRVAILPSQYPDNEYEGRVYIHRSSMQSAVESCSKKLNVALEDDKSTVIGLTYKDVSIQRAEEIINTIIGVYNENWVKDKNQIAVSTSMFISDRLGVIEQELGNVDEDISSYKSEHLLPDVQAASSLYMNESSETSQKILELNTQLSMARYIRNYLTVSTTKNQLLPANSGLESDNIEQQIAEYNKLQLQRNNLVSNSSEQNPLVQDMDQSLTAMRHAIMTSIDNLEESLNAQIRSLEASERSTTAKIAANPDQAKYLLSVERQQKVKESLYLYLLQKREENELSQAFTAYNTRVITPPMGSQEPTSPVKRNVLLLAFLCGLLIPLTVIILKEVLNTTIRSKKDLESVTIPFLGEIPQYGKRKSNNGILVKEGSRNSINEAFRVVRTNYEFMYGGKGGNVTMILSMFPGSGKTFISSNIATVFAIRRRKVLIIDLDIRKATLSQFVNSPKKGITDYLSNHVEDVHDVIVKGELHSYLDVIPVGTIPPNPTELLSSIKLKEAIDTLKKEYEYVFLDCPPVGIMADADIIAKVADHTIFVVRVGLFSKEALPELESYYAKSRFKDLSIILNGSNVVMSYYGHYGRYGDYYVTDEDSKKNSVKA